MFIRCGNGQHIPREQVCNFARDCLDGSEEQYCDIHHQQPKIRFYRKQPPMIILAIGYTSFIEMVMKADDPCPETHFRCPGEDVYCMPVYLRCNQVKDCPHGEDELSCEAVSCPDYYRCRGSSVCLHPSHVCDGWPQCPQRDDQLLCDASCPSVCQCQGLAFVCRQPFPVVNYPGLKYLDAERSGIKPVNVLHNFYLIYLNLAKCELDSWPALKFENLQYLELGHNKIRILYLEAFCLLSNLRNISLTGNPLSDLVKASSDVKQTSLLAVDLSVTNIRMFDSSVFTNFQSIMDLNVSYSGLISVSESGLVHLPRLRHLDISGCLLEEFPGDLFKRLTDLQFVRTENNKLCCKVTLPRTFNTKYCVAPEDKISSCEDLLRSNFYRSFLWLVGTLSIPGNADCFVFRIIGQKGRLLQSGYNAFVTNLTLSDCLMGLYLVIIGAADEVYRGRYLWNEKDWKENVMCTIAGFISLLSNEVSAFMICLITALLSSIFHSARSASEAGRP